MKLLISLFTCFLLFTSQVNALSYTKEISQAELQQTVAGMMPKTIKKFVFDITFSQPIVSLLTESDELALQTNIDVFGLNLKGSGVVHIKGRILYDATQGAFYLKTPTIIDLHIDNLEEKYQEQVKQLAQNSLSQVLAVQPIFKLDDKDLRQSMAKMVLEDVKVTNGKLVLTLAMF